MSDITPNLNKGFSTWLLQAWKLVAAAAAARGVATGGTKLGLAARAAALLCLVSQHVAPPPRKPPTPCAVSARSNAASMAGAAPTS
eukprot:758077-Hanusia_phi.AAC.3